VVERYERRMFVGDIHNDQKRIMASGTIWQEDALSCGPSNVDVIKARSFVGVAKDAMRMPCRRSRQVQ